MPLFEKKQDIPYEEILKRLDKQISTVDENTRFIIKDIIRKSPNPKLQVNNELIIKELAVYLDEFLRSCYLKLLPPQSVSEYVAIIQRMKQGKVYPLEEQRFLQTNIENFRQVSMDLVHEFEQGGYMCYELRLKNNVVWVFNVGKTRGRFSPYRK